MSVPQGSFDGMTDKRFVKSTVAAAVSLSPSQVEVENLAPDSIAVVFGAPGVGKTQAAKALFYRLAREIGPDNVLVLAANRESANRLRDELALGYQGATAGPLARTITSFAFGVLRMKAIQEGSKLPELISGS
jgi:superfamily I DNA/RNA helicase